MKDQGVLRYARTAVISIGILLMMISMIPGLTWSQFDRTSAIGPADYRLKVDFDAVGFDYRIDIKTGEGGGVIGGMTGNGTNTIEDEKKYPQVKGEFLDNVGLLYDSYREKSFQYELKMRTPPENSNITWEKAGNPAAHVNVTLESDLIPWWPEVGRRSLDVRMDLFGVDLIDQVSEEQKDVFSVHVTRVSLKALTSYDKETGEYEGDPKELASKEVDIRMDHIGESRKVTFDMEYPEGEEAIGLFAEIQGNLTDFWGRPELSPLPGRSNPINIYPLSTGKLVLGIGMPLALPLMLQSAVLCLISLFIGLKKDRSGIGTIVPGALLSLIAPIWFFLGMNAAVDLLGERLTGAEEGLSWGAGILFSFGGAVLIIAALVLSVIINRKKNRKPPSFREVDDKESIDLETPRFKNVPPPEGPKT
ncbi:MAG: hypothetical protein R6V01_01555 [Thermoplasmatota archaeon]